MNATEVVAALIWDGPRFLICQRPAHKARGLLWEFVGGKVEPGETREAALVRECREELDITVSVGDVFMTVLHEYPDLTVRLTLFHAQILEGTPKKLEHNAIRWITIDEIDQQAFCPADEEILEQLRQWPLRQDAVVQRVRQRLWELQDAEYRRFHSRLVPTIHPETVIGVRIPALRGLARELSKSGDAPAFLMALPHCYYEENTLHALLISEMRDYRATIAALRVFLPHVDNWATCDSLRPKAFRKHPPELRSQLTAWLRAEHPYTARFAMEMLMVHYLDAEFQLEDLRIVAKIRRKEYYVNMMIAWYMATALAKQYDAALPILTERLLPPWTHNKTIQKALESYRLSESQKKYLRKLKLPANEVKENSDVVWYSQTT